jgi:hypothetical protein
MAENAKRHFSAALPARCRRNWQPLPGSAVPKTLFHGEWRALGRLGLRDIVFRLKWNLSDAYEGRSLVATQHLLPNISAFLPGLQR